MKLWDWDLTDSVGITFASNQNHLKVVLCLKCVKSRLVAYTFQLFRGNARTFRQLDTYWSTITISMWCATKRLLAHQQYGFDSINEAKDESKQVFKAIPEKTLFDCFKSWKNRWHCACIAWRGERFEGNKIVEVGRISKTIFVLFFDQSFFNIFITRRNKLQNPTKYINSCWNAPTHIHLSICPSAQLCSILGKYFFVYKNEEIAQN